MKQYFLKVIATCIHFYRTYNMYTDHFDYLLFSVSHYYTFIFIINNYTIYFITQIDLMQIG